MQFKYGIRHIPLELLLLCIQVGQYFTLPPPLQLPIFDTIYMRLNNFNESIMDTITYFDDYDFIIIGSGSGKLGAVLYVQKSKKFDLSNFMHVLSSLNRWIGCSKSVK